jgi:hypothetical protein
VRARPWWTSGCEFVQWLDPVAGVADRDLAVEAAELLLGEDLRDEPEIPQDRQPAAVRDGDAGGLLAAVLEREEAEVRDARDVAPG